MECATEALQAPCDSIFPSPWNKSARFASSTCRSLRTNAFSHLDCLFTPAAMGQVLVHSFATSSNSSSQTTVIQFGSHRHCIDHQDGQDLRPLSAILSVGLLSRVTPLACSRTLLGLASGTASWSKALPPPKTESKTMQCSHNSFLLKFIGIFGVPSSVPGHNVDPDC